MEPKVSVVIPTFQRPKFLRKCLKALSCQTLESHLFEVIVVSDGPSPQTKRLISYFRNKIKVKYFSLPKHQGPAAARNRGWKKAKSNIIGFTDDDTIPNRNWLKTALNELEKGTPVLAGKIYVPIPKNPTYYEKLASYIEHSEFVTANCFCLKSALKRVEGFDERFDIAWREDSDLQFKFIENNIPIKRLDHLKVIHPLQTTTLRGLLAEKKKNRYDALLFKKHPELYLTMIRRHTQLLIIYYTTVVSTIIAVLTLSEAFFLLSAFLITLLIAKRLWETPSYSFKSITEIIFTSLFNPFLSVFWRLYGAIKYRVLFF